MTPTIDATTKELIDAFPADWAAWLGAPQPERAEPLSVDLTLGTIAPDRVLRVGGNLSYLVHIEIQASYDARIVHRLLRYNALLTEKYELPVESVLLLLTPRASHRQLNGREIWALPNGFETLVFNYRLIRLWEVPAQHFLRRGLGILPLAILADPAPFDLATTIRQVDARLTADVAPSVVEALWSSVYWLAGVRWDRDTIDAALRGVRNMRESSTYQAAVAEGIPIGQQSVLLALGGQKFGPAPSEVEARIHAITDQPTLLALVFRISQVDSWTELLATRV